MRKRSVSGRIAAAIIAIVLCVLLVKLFSDSFWEIVLFFVLSLLAGDFIAEFMEKKGWLGRKR
jgi:general stress protein CsbA